MFIFGKIIGALLGYLVWPPFGALLGGAAGHAFDVGLKKTFSVHSPEQLQKVQLSYFKTVFQLLGYMAKSDGQVSEDEVQQTETMMTEMGLTAEHRKQAILYFKEGTKPSFDYQYILDEFVETCGQFANLKQLLLEYLIALALSDDSLDDAENLALRSIANKLGYGERFLEHTLRMVAAQRRFADQQQSSRGYQQQQSEQHSDYQQRSRGHSGSGQGDWRNKFSPESEMEAAYAALDVSSSASDAEVKKAYRKLMSQYHPDKLIGQGVPEDMIKVATEKSQEIQRAYDLIKQSRK